MNHNINLINLIQKEKDSFFLPFEEEQGFINKNAHSDNAIFLILTSGIPVINIPAAYLSHTGYLEKHPLFMTLIVAIIVLLLYLFIACKSVELFRTFYFKRKFRKSSNSKIKQHLEKFYIDEFNTSLISDEIHNAVKVDFSMDEYKHLLSQSKNNNDISYGQLLNFIEKREHYKKERQAIEESKNSVHLSPSEIKAYQMEHLP